MAIFSRHRAVLDADDRPMTVKAALEVINRVLDEYLGEHEGEMDVDSRFAVTWFETRGYEPGPYGEAETVALARNVAVAGIEQAGIIAAAAGKVRLLERREVDPDWDPSRDSRLTVWEATQHLIRVQQEKGEDAASRLLAAMPSLWDGIRALAYRLYTICERKGWAEEARAYNGLITAWPDLEARAAQVPVATPMQQQPLFQ